MPTLSSVIDPDFKLDIDRVGGRVRLRTRSNASSGVGLSVARAELLAALGAVEPPKSDREVVAPPAGPARVIDSAVNGGKSIRFTELRNGQISIVVRNEHVPQPVETVIVVDRAELFATVGALHTPAEIPSTRDLLGVAVGRLADRLAVDMVNAERIGRAISQLAAVRDSLEWVLGEYPATPERLCAEKSDATPASARPAADAAGGADSCHGMGC